ncbi:MAG: hypothetical protein ACYC1P_10375 [Gaiellaceae bacterium]
MNEKSELCEALSSSYRGRGWKVEHAADGTVRASGIGGVTWIGLPVVAADLAEEGFGERLLELADQRMPQGALCPLELLPAEDCADELRAVLARLRLSERGHVEVYSLAA